MLEKEGTRAWNPLEECACWMTVTNAQRMGLLTALRTPFTRVSGEKSQNKKDVFFPPFFSHV